MAFYRICPDCGAYLDPGEQCSCHEERLIEMERKEKAKDIYAAHIHGLPDSTWRQNSRAGKKFTTLIRP